VLSKLKYREHDLILKAYTESRGIVSYMLRGVLNSKKRNQKIAYFQPLSQLVIEETYKPNKSLQTLKEVKLNYNYQSLHTNILKSAIALFIAETLNVVLKEEEENKDLFKYISTALQWLDNEDSFANFHLLFLLNLTKYLGFYPDSSEIQLPYFNLQKGVFQNTEQNISISGKNLTILKQLLGTNFDEVNSIKLNSKQRQSFLNMLLRYFELHLGAFKKPESLDVFSQVFS
jgi:DNA repair protein RecO (recombination protein O)